MPKAITLNVELELDNHILQELNKYKERYGFSTDSAIAEVLYRWAMNKGNKSMSSKTIEGLLRSTYYSNKKELCQYSWKEFKEYGLNLKKYKKLFKKYEKSGFNKNLKPSFNLGNTLKDTTITTYEEIKDLNLTL